MKIDAKRFHPLQRFLVMQLEVEVASTGGKVVLPDTVAQAAALPLGRIVEAGPECTLLKAGELVLFTMSKSVMLGRESGVLLVDERDCWAKVDGGGVPRVTART